MNFSGHNEGVQQDGVARHSVTAARRTTPALYSGAACVSHAAACVSPAAVRVSPWMPDVPRLLSLSPALLCQRARLPSTKIKTGGGRKCTFPGILQKYSRNAVAPHSTTAAQTAPSLAPRAARGDPLVARPAGSGHSRAAATASETAEQIF